MSFKLAQVVVYFDPEMVISGIYKILDIIGSGVTMYVLENENIETESYEENLCKPEDALVCKQCGNFHMQIKSWTDLNTTKYIEDIGTHRPTDYWCTECQSNTTPIPASVFHANTIIKLKS